MLAVEPREHLGPLALARPEILPSPKRDRVGYSDHDRFRGYVPVHLHSGLLPPCLRFAVYVTGHHARLGARLLARLCRGRHLRRLTSIRLQGATPTPPGIRFTYLGGSTGLSFNAQCRCEAGRESRKRDCAVPSEVPGVLTYARSPSANRRQPRQGISQRLYGAIP